MADNYTANPGSGGLDFASDDIASVHYPRGKITLGADGQNDGDVSAANPLPVTAAALPLPTGAATAAIQATQQTALAAIQVATELLDNVVESDRAKTSPIAGQAGVAAGSGAVGANTQRVTLASDDPALQSLNVIDDWDESDRAKVNVIVGQAGMTGGAGTVAANTPRVTLASNDSAVAALQIIDDWDESDRCKTNLIVGQAGISAGAGAVAANTPRLTLASDDPAVVALQILDNIVAGNEAQCDVITQPARAATVDSITAKLATDALHNGAAALTPKFVKIDASGSGNNTILAAVASKKIRVLAYTIIAAGDVDAKFQDGAGGTDLTGAMDLAANTGVSPAFCPVGQFETTANTLLNLNLSGAVAVRGHLTYVEV